MNLSRNWLADFVDVSDIENKAYCDRMTDTGSKVEGFEVLGEDIENVLVGRITSITPHENSDHLQICMLNVGGAEDVQIVTGAQNVFEGAIVPVALAPAKLPGDVVIKAGKLRGVASNGMLCSIGELNLTTHDMPGAIEDGILILDESFGDKIGMDIREALMLSDSVVEFEITSNRPDCLSVIGLARETAVSFDRDLRIPTPAVKGVQDGDTVTNHITVAIDDPELCPRYTARVVKNVKIAPSPLWLRMRLRASGVRPINNIVDITNYVMLEYGQPMHAFDYACLDGSAIRVRRAAAGEQFMSLDDQPHTLDETMLVIADANKAVALAGVMGGANSEITEKTATVVFESANFMGASVRVTAKKQGMRTESSSRFEKGLDPENTLPAIQRACELVELLGAGDVVDGIIDLYPGKTEPTVLPLEPEKINYFLGVKLDGDYMADILRRLDCKVENGMITVPSFRADLACMADIAEEIIRIYGYNTIESTSINAGITQGCRTPEQAYTEELHNALVGMGLYQIETFSFISPKFYDRIALPADSPLRRSVVISNPLGEDTSVMRTTALPSMLDVLARNKNFANENVALYEMATVYIPDEDSAKLPDERKQLTLGMYGNGVDFYRLKGVCENLLDLSGISGARYVACGDDPTFHPGRCAKIMLADGSCAGILGEVHPTVARTYDLDNGTLIAALDFAVLFAHRGGLVEYKPLPKFPASTRDFSFVCAEALEVGHIEEIMAKAGGKLVEDIRLFDIYRGPQIGEGNKSVSIRVTLRAADRTLTVEECDKAAGKIIAALDRELGIKLRG
ncbi:MAG: phenylalanine--tRNA ligase subunit beta [Ruminococcaceae bacterium]|nr:phenylalanine--tRNA ligase subunit beta [Oscillospiraceae bacterium]